MTVDADQLFATTASELMAEMGLDYGAYTKDEMHQFYDAVVAESQACWDEFMLWVACGEDNRERTRMLLKAQMMKGGAL